MKDSITAEGWMKKSNMVEPNYNPIQAMTCIDAPRHYAKLFIMDADVKGYSQWFMGKLNNVADALLQDWPQQQRTQFYKPNPSKCTSCALFSNLRTLERCLASKLLWTVYSKVFFIFWLFLKELDTPKKIRLTVFSKVSFRFLMYFDNPWQTGINIVLKIFFTFFYGFWRS